MADQQKWFKLWVTAPGDEHLQRLSAADCWAWAVLGAYTKAHGTRGSVEISAANSVLAAEMRIDVANLLETVLRMPHIKVQKSDNGAITVTWQNWTKYQEDSSVYERVKRLRSKKRGEERRREERRISPSVSPPRGETPPSPLHLDPNPNGDEPDDQEAAEALGGDAPEHTAAVPDELRDAMTLLEFLNAKTGRTYGIANLALIDARLREGWSVQQCRTMVMRKWRDWRDDEKMRPFARPATLFNRSKLEGYMAELGFTTGA